MRWTWDPRKAVSNRSKHGLSFELATQTFDDPLHLSQPDPHPDSDRWQTIGCVGPVCLFVVHTWDEEQESGRIISARKATRYERRQYEEQS
jgi:hypothetical protein